MTNRPNTMLLCIRHSLGSRIQYDYNAIALIHAPCWDSLVRNYSHLALDFSGIAEELPGEYTFIPKTSQLA